jgi:hypothetical protein
MAIARHHAVLLTVLSALWIVLPGMSMVGGTYVGPSRLVIDMIHFVVLLWIIDIVIADARRVAHLEIAEEEPTE